MSSYVLISDTHDNLDALGKFIKCLKHEHNVEGVIHLGDITSPFTLKAIKDHINIIVVVLGNNDADKLLLSSIHRNIYDHPIEYTLDGLKLLLMHGFGSKDFTLKFVRALARGSDYDIIAYGHTHEHLIEKLGKTLILNPGALSGYLSNDMTYALLNMKEGYVSINSIRDCRSILTIKMF